MAAARPSSDCPAPPAAGLRRAGWGAALLGFALGGFFDGILLHQILQWHHLLSAVRVDGASLDLRTQVLADGLFHALMYVVAAIGLVLHLNSVRRVGRAAGRGALPAAAAGPAQPGEPGAFAALFLIGFGAWHVADALLSHGLLGLHRIRMDVAEPLAWDLGWLIVFGLLPLAAGWGLTRRMQARGMAGVHAGRPGARPGRPLPGLLPWLLVTATLFAGWQAQRPARPADGRPAAVAVVLRPGAPAAAMLQAAARADARILWVDAAQAVWLLQPRPGADLRALYRHGALYVAGTLTPAGCAAWLRGPAAGRRT